MAAVAQIPIEELQRLQEAGVALNPTGVERLRAFEQNQEQAEDDAVAARRDALVDFNEIAPAYTDARTAASAAYETAVRLMKEAAELRLQYERSWNRAHALGIDVPVRIPPASRPAVGFPSRW